MRIFNREKNLVLNQIDIFLNEDEIHYLTNMLNELIKKPKIHHVHVNDEKFERELTVSLYTDHNLNEFDQRSREVILKGI